MVLKEGEFYLIQPDFAVYIDLKSGGHRIYLTLIYLRAFFASIKRNFEHHIFIFIKYVFSHYIIYIVAAGTETVHL